MRTKAVYKSAYDLQRTVKELVYGARIQRLTSADLRANLDRYVYDTDSFKRLTSRDQREVIGYVSAMLEITLEEFTEHRYYLRGERYFYSDATHEVFMADKELVSGYYWKVDGRYPYTRECIVNPQPTYREAMAATIEGTNIDGSSIASFSDDEPQDNWYSDVTCL